MDVFHEASVAETARSILEQFGQIDILVNCVGGNRPNATTSPDRTFFDLTENALEEVIRLNFLGGTVLPCRHFGRSMVNNPNGGSIINISSMAAWLPLTRVAGYSAAKAAVENFTKWLAVHLAQEHGRKVRVNAIAPGFFRTDQNRFLLEDEQGKLTERGRVILERTPLGRFGEPEDLAGAAVWLASDASRFVTGAVIPVDGGFSAYSGV